MLKELNHEHLVVLIDGHVVLLSQELSDGYVVLFVEEIGYGSIVEEQGRDGRLQELCYRNEQCQSISHSDSYCTLYSTPIDEAGLQNDLGYYVSSKESVSI